MRIYGDAISGNCYKIKLLLTQLGRDFDWVDMDVVAGDTRQSGFLARNPNGKVPLLELDDGRLLAESNAILCYLARGTDYWPDEPFAHAQVLQWLFFEQYSHEPYIATSRFLTRYLGGGEEYREQLEARQAPGYRALEVMEQQLAEREYLVAERYSIADIALYAYTHVADEGGFSLERYPAIRRWLAAVAAQPGYVGIYTE